MKINGELQKSNSLKLISMYNAFSQISIHFLHQAKCPGSIYLWSLRQCINPLQYYFKKAYRVHLENISLHSFNRVYFITVPRYVFAHFIVSIVTKVTEREKTVIPLTAGF